MRYFSLFSGIGGFELGIEWASQGGCACGLPRSGSLQRPRDRSNGGHDAPPVCVGFSEIDKYAASIYQRHFPTHRSYGDITKIAEHELPEFDLLVGGFPCQAFSIAGKRHGFADTRGTLFFEIVRLLKAKRPRLLLLENVKGLLSHDGGDTFWVIISTLDELGYDLQWQVLNSKNFGVPQNRERVFIVGHLRGTPRPEVFPFTASGPADTRKCGTDLSYAIDSNYWKGPSGEADGRRQTAGGVRRLTPTECERLQGFPDGWTEGVSDTQRYKCLGNAVTVNVIEAICTRMLAD